MFDNSPGTAQVRFATDDVAFAARIFDVFGENRFTVQTFYRRVSRKSRSATSVEDVTAIYKVLEAHAAALLPAPGARGDDGWRLHPKALAAVHHARMRYWRSQMAKRAKSADFTKR